MGKIFEINANRASSITAADLIKFSHILKCAKAQLYDSDGKLDRKLFSDALDTFGVVCKSSTPVLIDEIYALLESKNDTLREESVATLGYTTRFHLPEFRDKAYEILSNDPSPSVRATALSAWAGYFFKSYNPSTLWRIYLILVNESNDLMLRAEAFCGICNIAPNEYPGFNPVFSLTPLLESETTEEFNSKIDWNEVERIINKYVPSEKRTEK